MITQLVDNNITKYRDVNSYLRLYFKCDSPSNSTALKSDDQITDSLTLLVRKTLFLMVYHSEVIDHKLRKLIDKKVRECYHDKKGRSTGITLKPVPKEFDHSNAIYMISQLSYVYNVRDIGFSVKEQDIYIDKKYKNYYTYVIELDLQTYENAKLFIENFSLYLTLHNQIIHRSEVISACSESDSKRIKGSFNKIILNADAMRVGFTDILMPLKKLDYSITKFRVIYHSNSRIQRPEEWKRLSDIIASKGINLDYIGNNSFAGGIITMKLDSNSIYEGFRIHDLFFTFHMAKINKCFVSAEILPKIKSYDMSSKINSMVSRDPSIGKNISQILRIYNRHSVEKSLFVKLNCDEEILSAIKGKKDDHFSVIEDEDIETLISELFKDIVMIKKVHDLIEVKNTIYFLLEKKVIYNEDDIIKFNNGIKKLVDK